MGTSGVNTGVCEENGLGLQVGSHQYGRSSRCYECIIQDPKATHSDSIEVGGLMLMKTPEEFVAQRTAHYNKATQAQAEAVNNSFMKENDARMPLFSEKKSTTTFGKK
jgi:hypothetical protein